MQLENYFSPVGADGQNVQFSREQASDFAKQIANDFNPIHDSDAKRFCVPGDLLFSIGVSKLGLSQKMHIDFADMLSDGIAIGYKEVEAGKVDVQDDKAKRYLSIESSGERCVNQASVLALVKEYVAFSGLTFPHILVPLWKEKNAMVNPARPLVIYQSMTIELDTLDFERPQLELGHCELDVNGKRGNVILRFNFISDGKKIGTGEKRMVLSGLREYDQTVIDELSDFYSKRKTDYQSKLARP